MKVFDGNGRIIAISKNGIEWVVKPNKTKRKTIISRDMSGASIVQLTADEIEILRSALSIAWDFN